MSSSSNNFTEAATPLSLSWQQGKIQLADISLNLNLDPHQGLLLLAELDKQLGIHPRLTSQIIQDFCRLLLTSLEFLGTRERQQLLGDAPLATLACLLRRFRNTPQDKFLRANISQRRLSQVKEEIYYLSCDLEPAEEVRTLLEPFCNRIQQLIVEQQLQLPDPQGGYFY